MEETICDDTLPKTRHIYLDEAPGEYFEIDSTDNISDAKIETDVKKVKVLDENISSVPKPKALIPTSCKDKKFVSSGSLSND